MSEEEEQEALYRDRFESEGRDAIGGVGSALSLGKRYCRDLREAFPESPKDATHHLAGDRELLEIMPHDIAIEVFCPEFADTLAASRAGFGEGAWVVGDDIAPGTYRTAPKVSDCYWEITDSNGRTVVNDFAALAPEGVSVTLESGRGFVSNGCGGWLPSDR